MRGGCSTVLESVELGVSYAGRGRLNGVRVEHLHEARVVQTAMSRLEAYLSQFMAEDRLTREEADATLARLSTTTDPDESATGAGLISESVPEDPKLKRRVFAQFNELCRPEAFCRRIRGSA